MKTSQQSQLEVMTSTEARMGWLIAEIVGYGIMMGTLSSIEARIMTLPQFSQRPEAF